MRSGRAELLAATALAVAGCAPTLPPLPAAPLGEDASALAATVHALAREVEREPRSARRSALAREAVAAGERCEQLAPASAPCDYALGIALGIQVREHPTALGGLARMVSLLRRAAANDADLDHGGPDRVLALLLLRAPGWPLGPGDAEEGLAAARRAVEREATYPPNQLALAEALVANGDPAGGREAARRALTAAERAGADGEPDAPGWIRRARELAGGG